MRHIAVALLYNTEVHAGVDASGHIYGDIVGGRSHTGTAAFAASK
jgi:hypothetical protein